jgi:prepilin-type processing-associated H-X9-DG protein
MCQKKQLGFTLIEVMAIVAVLGFVVVIVATTVNRQRESKNRSACQWRLKMLGQAVLQYAGDYDDRLPLIDGGGKARDFSKGYQTPRYGWADNLQPYLNVYVYRCPSLDIPIPIRWGDANPARRDYTTYYYNSNLNKAVVFLVGKAYNPKALEPPISARKAEVVSPGRSILFGEGVPGDARYNRTATEHSGQPPADERHLTGGNYAFLDGHARWLKPEQIFNGAQPAAAGTKGSPTNLGGYAATHLVR